MRKGDVGRCMGRERGVDLGLVLALERREAVVGAGVRKGGGGCVGVGEGMGMGMGMDGYGMVWCGWVGVGGSRCE